MTSHESNRWDVFCADAWTDDWLELCDDLGIEWRDLPEGDQNSRQLRKIVRAWAQKHDAWDRVEQAISRNQEES